jgi:hypothetical protein
MVTYLRVDADKREMITRECDHEDRWDRDDTASEWTFNSVSTVEEDSYFDIVVPFEVKRGDKVWVVSAIYSTGDSFGTDDSACCEYIDAFLDKSKADACREVVLEKSVKDRRNFNNDSVKWIREDGSESVLQYAPWNGYFESLDEVRCEHLEVVKC